MRIDVVTEPDVDAATDEAICRLQRRAFPTTEQFGDGRQYIHHTRAGDVGVLAWVADQLVGQVVLYWAAADQGRLACLGNVCSDPDVRGRGYVSACVRRAVDLARDGRADWMLLFCREPTPGFYRRFGFERVDHAVWHTRTDGSTYAHGHDDVCMVLRLADRPWPTETLLLDIENF